MDNIEIAILTKLNDLAERHGLKPYDYVATIDSSSEHGGCRLTFTIPGETDRPQEVKARIMFEALGVATNGVLKGGEVAVFDAIDHALSIAPQPRRR